MQVQAVTKFKSSSVDVSDILTATATSSCVVVAVAVVRLVAVDSVEEPFMCDMSAQLISRFLESETYLL